jgi:hypothetical protein
MACQVYKARWNSAKVDKFNVNDNLPKINDRQWVMQVNSII